MVVDRSPSSPRASVRLPTFAVALAFVACTERPLGDSASDGGSGSGGDTVDTSASSLQPTDGGPGTITSPVPTTGHDTATTGATTVDPTVTTATSLTSATSPTSATTDTPDTDGDTDDPPSGAPLVGFPGLTLEVADFDGDGENDLLVTGVGKDIRTKFWRGLGDGTFQPGITNDLSGASVFPAVGDLDVAPGIEVMFADPDGLARAYTWIGDDFSPFHTVASPVAPRNHLIADLDADGRRDVVALWDGATDFGLTLHIASDQFTWQKVTTDLGDKKQLGFAPEGALVGDFDGDPFLDLLLYDVGVQRGFLRVFGAPGGNFVQPEFLAGELTPHTAGLGDFDEDGALDVLLVEHAPTRMSLATGDGLGGFAFALATPIDDSFVPLAFDLDDLDLDGHLDVVAVDDATAELRFWTGRGDGSFDPPGAIALPSPAVRVHAARFDFGPDIDLAVATFDAGLITIALNPAF